MSGWTDVCTCTAPGARGHLRANIEHEPRACFAIDEPGEVFDYGRFECDSTVSYASVVAFGRVTVVEDVAIKQRFFTALMAKYRTAGAPRPKDFFPRIDQIALYQLAIDRFTGKQIVLPDIAGQWPALDRSKTPNARMSAVSTGIIRSADTSRADCAPG